MSVLKTEYELALERDLELLEARLHNAELALQATMSLVQHFVGKEHKAVGALERFHSEHYHSSKSLGAFESNLFNYLEDISPVSEPSVPDNLKTDLMGNPKY